MQFLILFISLAVLSTACAAIEPNAEQQDSSRLPTNSEVEQYNAQVEPEHRIICRQETKVGTNIPKRVCRLVRDLEETSNFHREQLRRVLQ